MAQATSSCCDCASCTAGRFKTAPFRYDSGAHSGLTWAWFAAGGGDWYEAIVALYGANDK